jgi:ATP-dependent helicase/nuclease subunit A
MPLNQSQSAAVKARGNVIVVAGAGTGKTRTLIDRCVDIICCKSTLECVLMVTFTEAAATEMRHRLRQALQKLVDESGEEEKPRFAEQLALVETAKISTIHSFCLRLVQAHFHQLGLDPEVKVLDDQQTRLLAQETLDALIEECFANQLPIGERVRGLITTYAPDRDTLVRELVLKLHKYTQSLPNAAGWIQDQQGTSESDSQDHWERWLLEAFEAWRQEWQPRIQSQAGVENIDACLTALSSMTASGTRLQVAEVSAAVAEAGAAKWPRGTAGKVRDPLLKFFDEAGFFASVAAEGALESDWQAVGGHLGALLALTAEFTARFTAAKRELGGVDFPDLEQLTLRLLLHDDGSVTSVAREWRKRLDFVFVDECQDINGAQDAILSAVSREGAEANRFLVGDVKQSIYQFRLADPRIFQDYEKAWGNGATAGQVGPAANPLIPGSEFGQRIPLTENFRSRPGILAFANELFSGLMRDTFGGVGYEPLQAGAGSDMANLGTGPCVELHLIRKDSDTELVPSAEGGEITDLSAAEREARLLAVRLRELKESAFTIWDKDEKRERKVEWHDMAILMRSPGPRTEVLAKVFHQAGIPLIAERAGFLEAIEVSDLVSVLKLLDNPLQDIPLLAVLRSPLVGLTLDELATIRADNAAKPFWAALRRFAGTPAELGNPDAWEAASCVPPEDQTCEAPVQGGRVTKARGRRTRTPDADDAGRIGEADVKRMDLPAKRQEPLKTRISAFFTQFERWRELVRQVGPSLCLEQVLTDTNYDVLLGANERGAQQQANVRRLLDLARQFDPYLRQGLYRFLRFLKALEEADESLEPAPPPARNAVRLMSVHKSKGLEFPVVVLAGLGTRFNLQGLNGLVLLDSEYGLVAKAMTASGAGRYPTLPFWLAERRQRAQQLAEELRLWYVAVTRARDRLICTGLMPKKDLGRWTAQPGSSVTEQELLGAQSPMNWLLAWLPGVTQDGQWDDDAHGKSALMTWKLWDPQDEQLRTPGASVTDSRMLVPESAADPAVVAMVQDRLSWSYAHAAAAKEPAKSSVSALRRRSAELLDDDAVNRFAGPRHPGQRQAGSENLSAAERGTLHHRFLQHVAIEGTGSVEDLAAQASALVRLGIFSEEETATLDMAKIAAFWASGVGRQIREQPGSVRRELPFTARFENAEVRSLLGQEAQAALMDEFVVVQGVVDLAVVLKEEIWLLDFKTDAVQGEALTARSREYEPQVQLYAAALEKIFQKPVRHQWLHFLATGVTVELPGAASSRG